MKGLIALSILMAASVNAATFSTSNTIGTTSSHTVGKLTGQESYSSVAHSESGGFKYGGIYHSEKYDEVNGVRKVDGNYSAASSGTFSGVSVDLNSAKFGVMSESVDHTSYSNIKVVDRYNTSGYELDGQMSNKGYSYEYSDYSGSFKDKSRTQSLTEGTTQTVTYSWYE